MGNGAGPPVDLQAEVAKRKAWFFECQLRRLTLSHFRERSIDEPIDDPLLDLISEPRRPLGYPGGQFGRMENLGQVYLDSQEPVWTVDEHVRRDAFSTTLTGKMCDWLEFKEPHRLAEAVAKLRQMFEESQFSSRIDVGYLDRYWRKPMHSDGGWTDAFSGEVALAISRATIADTKPWLIGELYTPKHHPADKPDQWLENLEQFIIDVESELGIIVGGTAGVKVPFDASDLKSYRTWVRELLGISISRDPSDAVKVSILDQNRNADGKGFTYAYNPKVKTNGYPLGNAVDYPHSFKVKYWTRVVRSALKEVYVNKENSDMGLCLLIRVLYLFGTMPETFGDGQELPWRKRSAPPAQYDAYFDRRASDDAFKNDAALLGRMRAAQARLRVLLEESAARPRAAAITFSPIVQEILRQGLHSYKFWLDEPLRAKGQAGLNKAKTDINTGKADGEMEYWSENHYIMFASSEYLAGQLWEADTFQPAKEFLDKDSDLGVLSGKERKERGRARVLKWLNHRLTFGWTEFNSSGYYREHLWAMLNLVDFALDDEVREKASIATDLLLFDVVRFVHKGTMGAAGGRSQFKSKVSGWDNAMGDVVELIGGGRGVFVDGNALIAASLATSTYRIPDVLLEIAANPPAEGFVDRSRVSIAFEEAPKYGITFTQQLDDIDSLRDGYALKLRRYSPHIDAVNKEIERTHKGLLATDEDIFFWWSTSAFYNKQIVRGTFRCIDKFGLDQTGVFKGFVPFLIETLIPLVKRFTGGLFGSLAGGLFGGITGAIAGVAGGVFSPEVLGRELEEEASDELSLLLEGSSRTRANILTYRNGGAMLSSLQNFRVGQFNFQSSVTQATLNGAINVFPTAGFAGLDISNLFFMAAGGLAGAAAGAGVVGGAVTGVVINETTIDQKNPFTEDEADGPTWWTGYWALPMVVQHRGAAIIVSDFHDIQGFLAEVGSHVWFPKAGFDRVDEVRSSAYDDDNFFLLDITNIGPKGFWIFGKVVHPMPGVPVADRPEGFIGVFSNERPEWLNLENDAEVYEPQFEKAVEDPIEDLEDAIEDKLDDLEDEDNVDYVGRQVIEIVINRALNATYTPNISDEDWARKAKEDVAANNSRSAMIRSQLGKINELIDSYVKLRRLQRVWPTPLPRDYFGNRDWYVEGKNIWIVQVGSKAEFGSFEAFKERVSAAKVTIDDSGDMECTYHMPLPGGGSEELSVDYEDGGSFKLNGQTFQTDLYPRFENPFVRSGRVEWGQREYVIEYHGKTLLHEFNDFTKPSRREDVKVEKGEADLVKALVLYVQTADEEMEEFTIATATVRIGCTTVTEDQVFAVGPVEEDVFHDAEWLFFDRSAACAPDLTLAFAHRAIGDGDDEAEWEMRFTLKALMGDRTLRDCVVSFPGASFDEDRRRVGPFPFVIPRGRWSEWETVPDSRKPRTWLIAERPPWDRYYDARCDLVVLDASNRLAHRRIDACLAASGEWQPVDGADGPDLARPFRMQAAATWPGNLQLFVLADGVLRVASPGAGGKWGAWMRIEPWVNSDAPLLPGTMPSPVPVPLGSGHLAVALSSRSQDGVSIMVAGADGHLYGHDDWRPYSGEVWTPLDVSGFSLAPSTDMQVAGGEVFALATDGALWSSPTSPLFFLGSSWRRLTFPGLALRRFSVTSESGGRRVVATAVDGSVWIARLQEDDVPEWRWLAFPGGGAHVPADSRVAWASASDGQLDVYAAGADGRVYINSWDAAADWRGWRPIVDDQGFNASAHSPMVTQRVKGQVEVFAQDRDGNLQRSWWS
jgi:hypothetical protein